MLSLMTLSLYISFPFNECKPESDMKVQFFNVHFSLHYIDVV